MAKSSKLTNLIIRLATQRSPQAFTAGDVLKLEPDANPRSVQTMLGQLAKKGKLERASRGHYRLALEL